jgi:repressor LexA
MQPDLTAKQELFLAYLQKQVERTGVAPSLRKAAADLKISHTSVAQFVHILEKKGFLKRDGHYSRDIYLLDKRGFEAAPQRCREVPIIGRISAGLPLYAQHEWDGTVVVDRDMFRGRNLFALRVKGNSMRNAGMLSDDIVICEPRQYAQDGEIVVALIHDDEATVKRFFLRKDHIELRPENRRFKIQRYAFGEVSIQGKIIGLFRGPAAGGFRST